MNENFLLINSGGSVYGFLKKYSAGYGTLETLILNGIFPQEESLDTINEFIKDINPEIIFIESRLNNKNQIHDIIDIVQADSIYKDIKLVYIGDSYILPESYSKICYSLNLPFTNYDVIKLINTIRHDEKFKTINDFHNRLNDKIINKSNHVNDNKLKI